MTTARKPSMKLKERLNASEAATAAPVAVTSAATTRKQASTTAAARIGKKATVGHFSEDMSRTINIIAATEARTVQSCMGEAWDMWLQSKGYQPFGER